MSKASSSSSLESCGASAERPPALPGIATVKAVWLVARCRLPGETRRDRVRLGCSLVAARMVQRGGGTGARRGQTSAWRGGLRAPLARRATPARPAGSAVVRAPPVWKEVLKRASTLVALVCSVGPTAALGVHAGLDSQTSGAACNPNLPRQRFPSTGGWLHLGTQCEEGATRALLRPRQLEPALERRIAAPRDRLGIYAGPPLGHIGSHLY